MSVELGVVEQRYRAVREVLDGMPVTDVAVAATSRWRRSLS